MDTPEAPGSMMRRLRLQRNLTLRDAALALDISSSALSRLERDLREVERSDVDMVIQGYGLGHWEASQLQMCAGIAPLPPSAGAAKAAWSSLTENLAMLTLPAFVLDEFNYLVAWNGPMHALWDLPTAPVAPLSPLQDIFSERARELLDDSWDATTRALCRHFYLRTLRVAGDTRLHKMLSSLARTHGSLFIDHWNMAMTDGAGPDAESAANLTLRVGTHEGVIEYIVTRGAAHSTLPIELYVQVPLGHPSASRHERLVANAEIGSVVRCQRVGPR